MVAGLVVEASLVDVLVSSSLWHSICDAPCISNVNPIFHRHFDPGVPLAVISTGG